MGALKIKTKSQRSKYVALDTKDITKVIAEGTTRISVEKKAKKTGKEYFTMFVPAGDQIHIY